MRENSERSAVQGALLLVLAGLVLPFAARAANEGEIHNYLRSINRLHESLDYELALNQIQLGRKLPRGTAEEVTLSLYEGIIHCEMGKQKPGASSFRAALLLRPDAKLPVQVAPKVEALFESVRKQVKQEVDSLRSPSVTEKPSHKTELNREAPPAPPATEPAQEKREDPREAAQREAKHLEAEQLERAHLEAERMKRERQEAERAQLKKKARDAANLDTSKCQPIVSIACEMLMKRLLFLRGALLRSDSPSSSLPLRELSMIGQEIRAGRTQKELQEAAQALDAWQQRHLSQ